MKKDNIFWISFTDLMISLFFIMLVLFVVSIGYLKNQMVDNENLIVNLRKEKEEKSKLIDRLQEEENETATLIDSLEKTNQQLIITVEQQNKLLKIEEQFRPLEDSGNFFYLENCRKYIVRDLMGIEIFEPDESNIKEVYKKTTLQVGHEIKAFLKRLNDSTPDLSYLMIIEGNVANTHDQKYNINSRTGYKKSYERALAVYNLWTENNIRLRDYNTEVLICGSGFSGICRDKIEENNKRFSIQIIPKVQVAKR